MDVMKVSKWLALPSVLVAAFVAMSTLGFDLIRYRPVLAHELDSVTLVAQTKQQATTDRLDVIDHARFQDEYLKWAAYVKELEYNKKPVPIEFRNRLRSLELTVKKFERRIFKLRDGG